MRFIRGAFITLFFALGALAVAVFVFYHVEDWRGAREWASVRRQLEARGESFDPARNIPPPVPPDQNLAMAPLFAQALRYRVDPKTGESTFSALDPSSEFSNMPEGPSSKGNPRPSRTGFWSLGQRRDLATWQAYYRGQPDFPRSTEPSDPAADVLLALTRYGPLLDELAREAAARPLIRFPVAWNHLPPAGIGLYHLNVLHTLTKTLCVRAIVELRLDRPAEALADLELCFRLREPAATEPAIISALFNITQLGLMFQPIWEGLADRRWTPEQIDRLHAHLGGINVLADLTRAIRGERNILMLRTLDDWRNHRRLGIFLRGAFVRELFSSPSGSEALLRLAPGGWFDQNKASGSRYYQEALLDAVQPAAHRVELRAAAARETAFMRDSDGIYSWFLKVSSSTFATLPRKFAQTQASLDCAVTACALEKYWCEHRAYPETLQALAPAFIPRAPVDLIDGASLRYRRTPDGRYQLYSIGGNEEDDGGTVVPNSAGSNADPEKGDWVWQYEAVETRPSAN